MVEDDVGGTSLYYYGGIPLVEDDAGGIPLPPSGTTGGYPVI